MKVEALNKKQIEKIVYALTLAYGDRDSWDDLGMKIAEDLNNADVVCIANEEQNNK